MRVVLVCGVCLACRVSVRGVWWRLRVRSYQMNHSTQIEDHPCYFTPSAVGLRLDDACDLCVCVCVTKA